MNEAAILRHSQGAVAQLGERLGRIEEVVGSNPICSILVDVISHVRDQQPSRVVDTVCCSIG